jgi:hypothetical protein
MARQAGPRCATRQEVDPGTHTSRITFSHPRRGELTYFSRGGGLFPARARSTNLQRVALGLAAPAPQPTPRDVGILDKEPVHSRND